MTAKTDLSASRIRQLLTLEETAAMLRKSPSQLRWLMHAGKAPQSALVGGRRLFDADRVAEWLDDQFAEAS